MKKIALLLAAVVAAGALASCNKEPEAPAIPEIPAPETPFYVKNVAEGYSVELGDKKADVEPTLSAKGDIDYAYVIEFVEENVERWRYEGNEGIALNYDLNDESKVCAIRITTDEWELPNGLSVGLRRAAIASMYDKEMLFKFKETEDLWLGFDENFNPVPFEYDPPVPYLICFSFDDPSVCDMITIQDNRPVGSIF